MTDKFESRYCDQLIGPYPAAADVYEERSPVNHTDQLSCPVLLLQGADDKVVPPDQAETMFRVMKGKGIPCAYVLFEGEGHGMGGWKPATQAIALNRMRDFLRIQLKPWDFTDNPHGDLTAY